MVGYKYNIGQHQGNEKRKKEINNGAGTGHNQYQICAGENSYAS